jgi:hypothetical protein
MAAKKKKSESAPVPTPEPVLFPVTASAPPKAEARVPAKEPLPPPGKPAPAAASPKRVSTPPAPAPVKAEPVKAEPVKPATKAAPPAKVEAPKPEPVKPEPVKPVAKAAPPPKVEAPKVEAPKVEAPKVEAPKVEAPKPEPVKPVAKAAPPPKVEAPKPEPVKVEAPKAEKPLQKTDHRPLTVRVEASPDASDALRLTITYRGPLAKQEKVSVRVGLERHNSPRWAGVRDVEMRRVAVGHFEAHLTVPRRNEHGQDLMAVQLAFHLPHKDEWDCGVPLGYYHASAVTGGVEIISP